MEEKRKKKKEEIVEVKIALLQANDNDYIPRVCQELEAAFLILLFFSAFVSLDIEIPLLSVYLSKAFNNNNIYRH